MLCSCEAESSQALFTDSRWKTVNFRLRRSLIRRGAIIKVLLGCVIGFHGNNVTMSLN